MTPRDKEYEEIALYLLGNLSEEIRERVERRLLTEESFFEELLIVEEELIDSYVAGDLPGDDRLRFEQHFLCAPERREKLRFARTLRRYASSAPEPTAESEPALPLPRPGSTWAERLRAFWGSRSGLIAATALVLAVIVVGALWLYRPRTQPVQSFATLTLTASAGNRADAVQVGRVKSPFDKDALRIYLTLSEPPRPTARYRAELENIDGEIKPLEVTGQDARSVSVVIPSTQLARGQYALRLFTTEGAGAERPAGGRYFFNVE